MASVVSVEAPVTPMSPPPVMATPEAAMKISHTSPDIPLDAQCKSRENGVHTNPRMQRQTTEPSSSGRSMSEIGSVENLDFFKILIQVVVLLTKCFMSR